MENSLKDGVALTMMVTEKEIEANEGKKIVQEASGENGFENGVLRPRKQRTKWTIEETNDLLHGCSTVREIVGVWEENKRLKMV